MKMDAHFSIDRRYRYSASRQWDETLPPLVVCMLNPSDADETRNDPTLRELIIFGGRWGYGGLAIVNLYALVSSKPAELFRSADPVGILNGEAIEQALALARHSSGKLLVAWGNDAYKIEDGERARWFPGRAKAHDVELICLGRTRMGAPKHPMARGVHRIPRDQQPMSWIDGTLLSQTRWGK